MPRHTPPRANSVATRQELGLGSVVRARHAAHYASWADNLPMVRQRHPDVADTIITGFERDPALCFRAVRDCEGHLRAAGFEPRPWEAIAEGARLSRSCRRGVGRRRQLPKLSSSTSIPLWPTLSEPERAFWLSQQGPLASTVFVAIPTNRVARFDPQPFRVLMSRRLRLPMPLSSRSCRCGRLLDNLGHHRAGCAEAGVLGRHGFALECSAAQVC